MYVYIVFDCTYTYGTYIVVVRTGKAHGLDLFPYGIEEAATACRTNDCHQPPSVWHPARLPHVCGPPRRPCTR